MSYHEIEVHKIYRTQCRHCDFHVEAKSAGAAETAASDHIDAYDPITGEGLAYSHVVEIHEFTMVSR
jgi:hypothetical protein